MFTRHTVEFAQITADDAIKGAMLSLPSETIVETHRGFYAVRDLRPSDEIATLDGGFTPMSWVRHSLNAAPVFLIPAGALGNCTDMVLPADARVGMNAPANYIHATTDTLSVPLRALEGYKGVRAVNGPAPLTYTIGLKSEEMIWANTGALIHARALSDPFFHTLGFAETRTLISLSERADTTRLIAA